MTRTEIRNHVTLFINNKEIQINGKTDFHRIGLTKESTQSVTFSIPVKSSRVCRFLSAIFGKVKFSHQF